MKQKQENIEEKTVFQINENLLNIISPSGIDFNNLHTSLGENVGKIYSINKYPFTAEYGWLAPICNLIGTSTTIEYTHTDPARLVKVFDNRIKELKGNQDTLKKESDKQVNQRSIDDLKKMINRISVQNEPVGYVNIMLHIQDVNEEKLQNRIKTVSGMAAVQGCNLKLLKYKQGIALKVIAPYGMPDQDVSNMGERNMPISTFIGGFPMANPGIYDDDGYYLGKTTNDRMVILNTWSRNKDRLNSNWFITGLPGVGKSTALKTILSKEFAFGTRIIMLDPEEEYVELTKHPDINGDVINTAGGSSGRINPLQIRAAAKIKEEDLEPGEKIEDFFSYGEAEETSQLALYLQQLKVFFMLYFGKEEFTAGISAVLEQSLIELYKTFNITWDTDTSKLKNDEFPTMPELYKLVKEKSEQENLTDYKKQNYERLVDLLFSAGEGADRLWHGHTNMDSRANFVDLVISELLDADEKVKRAQFYNIIMWGWNELSKNRNEKVLFGVDEGYLLVDPEYPDIMKFLRNMSKRLRKYEGGLMFITHSVVDVLDPAVKRLGQAIIDNACYKFIMGCDGKNLEETTKLFNLSEKEQTYLGQLNRGNGILFAGHVRLELHINPSDEFLEMFGTAGGR